MAENQSLLMTTVYSWDELPILMLQPAITAQINADPPSIFEPRFL